MTALQAKPADIDLFEFARTESRLEFELACWACLVPRIERRLLRGLRLHFMPGTTARLEHDFWFGHLLDRHTAADVSFSPGMAGLLVEQLDNEQRADCWAMSQRLTRHWKPEERLQRDLYYYSLVRDQLGFQQVVRDIFRLIRSSAGAESDSRKRLLRLARMIKYSTAWIREELLQQTDTQQLLNYAANALHDPGQWSNRLKPVPLPDWLHDTLPTRNGSQLDVELRSDTAAAHHVLYFTEVTNSEQGIKLNSPLPAWIQVRDGNKAEWHLVKSDTRIAVQTSQSDIDLVTRDGRVYKLDINHTDQPEIQDDASVTPELLLAFAPGDAELAYELQGWLRAQGLEIILLEEKGVPSELVDTQHQSRVLRLWTRAMQKHWEAYPEESRQLAAPGLLLLADEIQPPGGYSSSAGLLDIRDWQHDEDQARTKWIKETIEQWASGEIKPDPHEPNSDPYAEERVELEARIENPQTTPQERLEIGDRLAEIGDTRSGVGVKQIEVTVESKSDNRNISLKEIDRLIESGENKEASYLLDNLYDEVNQEISLYESISDVPDYLFNLLLGLASRIDRLEDTDAAEELLKEVIEDGNQSQKYGARKTLAELRGIQNLVNELNAPDYSPQKRLEFGDSLNDFPGGDPRPGVGLDENGLPDIAWVSIPSGSFVYGEGGSEERREIEAFEIGRYPITNAQYQCFIDSGGYEDERWWQGLTKPVLVESTWPQANRPRAHVSWYDSTAFCRWLSAMTGKNIRLPTEYEWEKAGRGESGKRFPWGGLYRPFYANDGIVDDEYTHVIEEVELGQPVAVGMYPHAAKKTSVEDMVGNVWEWCASLYEKPEITDEGTEGARVRRGGAWDTASNRASLTYRDYEEPNSRLSNIGFRIVRVQELAKPAKKGRKSLPKLKK